VNEQPTFLNLDLAAPELRPVLENVALEDGAVSLVLVQGAAQPVGEEVEVASALGGAAGIGVAPQGDVYVADTDGDRVLRIPTCYGPAAPVGCLHAVVRGPRGVLAGPRESLYVADTGHHRILVVDLVTEQLRDVWGQRDRYGEPTPGDGDGELDAPWDLAADDSDRLYVVDHGNRRVQRFDADGRVDAAFAHALAHAATVPREPEYVATVLLDDEERLLVFDRTGPQRSRLLVYDLDGAFQSQATRRLRELLGAHSHELFASPPGAMAGSGRVLHVAEAATGRLLQFDLTGHLVGFARWTGSVAALALDAEGRLLVHPGTGSPVRLSPGRMAASGSFRIGPFAVPGTGDRAIGWQTLHARLDPLTEGAHLRLAALSTDDPAFDPPSLDDAAWRSAPVDEPAWLTGLEPARYLWVGGRLTSGDAGGPVVRGLRVDFDREGWLRWLPAIYALESSPFLAPALALLEDGLAEQEAHIDALPRLFDPHAAPADALPWLAGWLGWDLEEVLGEDAQRALIARAFELQGRRGTADGLRELVRIVLDADAAVTEPAARMRLWQLGAESGPLGWGTMLAAAEPDGAILGTTAELDHSHLQRDEDFGAPVFAATAHRFCVRVYGSDLGSPGARATLERLVERERPAEADAHVCVLEPRLRVGFQATVGVDAIVGCEPEPMRLGEGGPLGAGAALTEAPRRPTVGDGLRLGRGQTERGAR
jgi:phage tail-like protein